MPWTMEDLRNTRNGSWKGCRFCDLLKRPYENRQDMERRGSACMRYCPFLRCFFQSDFFELLCLRITDSGFTGLFHTADGGFFHGDAAVFITSKFHNHHIVLNIDDYSVKA